ncbi:hypothetical protein NC653_028623 [Populus alba x Populus x berolinensis]|uniref:Uncharacterized protein n=1 Tax=Populus alba x Populus x berolinensis TaxID=444605 RepID=A0AAD6M089_9ROSI|nr:hypothetical protein NC653_028623 [Populus alba x Populus x berolinensis]
MNLASVQMYSSHRWSSDECCTTTQPCLLTEEVGFFGCFLKLWSKEEEEQEKGGGLSVLSDFLDVCLASINHSIGFKMMSLIVMNMNMEEMKAIERVGGEGMEEVRDEPEDIKRIIYSVIVMKLNLTTGLVPNLNVSAALLAFVLLRTWTKRLSKAGIVTAPFTQQENTIVQTCARVLFIF